MKPIVILGAGGHARVLIDSLNALGREIKGLTDLDATGHVLGVPILGDDSTLPSVDTVELVNAIGSTGDTVQRRTVFDVMKAKGYTFATVVHPSAIVASHVILGEGAQVMAGAVVQVGTTIGANTIINTRAGVDHDCTIGTHVHIAPGATLSGSVRVGSGCHIGTGANFIQGLNIGDHALVAAGATVCRDVAANTRVAGTPAKELLP